jgi:O-antigen/teichoic acid export membrane protein
MINNKSLFKDILVYGVGDFIVTAINGFFLIPIYIKVLTPSEFGQLSIFNTNTLLFTYIIQMGLISGFARVYFNYNYENKQKYINSIISFHFISFLFFVILLYLFIKPYQYYISPSASKYAIVLSFIISFFSFLPSLFSIKYRIEEKVYKFVLTQVATVIIQLLTIFILLFLLSKGLNGVYNSLLITNAIVWGFFLFNLIFSFRVSIDFDSICETLKISFPIFLGYLMLFCINKFSLILLQKYARLDEIALYSFAQQLSTVVILFSIAAGKAIQPLIYKAEEDHLPQIFNKLNNLYTKSIYSIALLLLLFSNEIINFLSSGKFIESNLLFVIFIISNLFYSSVLLRNNILQYFMKSKMLFHGVLIGGLSSIILNYLLIPKWGIKGAAFSVLFSYVLLFLFNYLKTSKLLPNNEKLNLYGYNFFLVIIVSIIYFKIYFFIKLLMLPILLFFYTSQIGLTKNNYKIFFNNFK